MRSGPALGALALALAVALAGCAQEPADEAVQPGADPERGSRMADAPEGWTSRSFEAEYDLVLTGSWSNVQSTNTPLQDNCLLVRGAPFAIEAGNATATWSAQSGLAQELELTIVLFFGSHREEFIAGSPLQAEFGPLAKVRDVPSNEPEPFYMFVVQYPQPGGASALQDVHLRLAFSYLADHDVEVERGGCSID